jgi:hypothetical protein
MPYELSQIIKSLNAHGWFAVASWFAMLPVLWWILIMAFTTLLDGDGLLKCSYRPADFCTNRLSIWGLYVFSAGIGLLSHPIADLLRLGF